jgi:hypothetical protein
MSTATATAENKKPRSSGGAEKKQRRKEVLVFLPSALPLSHLDSIRGYRPAPCHRLPPISFLDCVYDVKV